MYSPTLAAVFAAVTRNCGLITTVHTTYHHPVQVARFGANLDVLSKGRWGINVVTGLGDQESALFGIEPISHDDRYEMADEFLDAVRQLWTCEPVEFRGKWFRFSGQMVGPPPVQHAPLVVNAGSSAAGQRFVARQADWIFLLASNEQVRVKLANLAEMAVAHGRSGTAVRPLLVGSIIVRDTDDEALEAAQHVRDSVDVDAAREYLQAVMGMDSYQNLYHDLDELDALRHQGSGGSGFRLYGSPETVAEKIVAIHRDFGCRGLALSFPLWSADEVRRTGESVLPLLEEAGVWTNPARRGWSW